MYLTQTIIKINQALPNVYFSNIDLAALFCICIYDWQHSHG